jgi:hypothetical protein
LLVELVRIIVSGLPGHGSMSAKRRQSCWLLAPESRIISNASVAAGSLTSRDLFAALGAVVIWGTNFVAMKYSLRDFTPFQLGAARYVFAALPLMLLMKRPQMPTRWMVYYGLARFRADADAGVLHDPARCGAAEGAHQAAVAYRSDARRGRHLLLRSQLREWQRQREWHHLARPGAGALRRGDVGACPTSSRARHRKAIPTTTRCSSSCGAVGCRSFRSS